MHPPIIKLEVERMQYTLKALLSEHAAAMDEMLQKAVDNYCTDDNLKAVIDGAARQALDAAIKEEVRAFFSYGDGRKAVAAAVKESILKNETYTRLDGHET